MKLKLSDYIVSHPGGEKWERTLGGAKMHQAAHDWIVQQSGHNAIVLDGTPILTLWDMLGNYYDAMDITRQTSQITIDCDAALRDWNAKLRACGL